jgi:hypothetical protein
MRRECVQALFGNNVSCSAVSQTEKKQKKKHKTKKTDYTKHNQPQKNGIARATGRMLHSGNWRMPTLSAFRVGKLQCTCRYVTYVQGQNIYTFFERIT